MRRTIILARKREAIIDAIQRWDDQLVRERFSGAQDDLQDDSANRGKRQRDIRKRTLEIIDLRDHEGKKIDNV